MGDIAEKIRNLRKQKNLTLKNLSEMTDLSISFLSQIENGSSSLAITSLKKIADALDVPITYFFDVPQHHVYETDVAAETPFRLEGSNAEFIRLSGEFPNRKMEGLITVLPPHSQHGESFCHPGEEFIYVLSGTLTVNLEGRDYHIQAGNVMHYPSSLPHHWRNETAETVKLLSVVTPVIF